MSEWVQPLPERTVVWVASDQTPPAELLHALSAKGLAVSVVGSAPAVLTALGSAGDGQVVLVEPERLPRCGELIEALQTYYPAVRCLRCDTQGEGDDAAGRPVLTLINGSLRSHTATDRAPREPGRDDQLPRLVRTDDEHDAPQPLITDEELSMLLGPVAPPDEREP